MMEVVLVPTETVRHAELQLDHNQHNTTLSFYGPDAFPTIINPQCQSTESKSLIKKLKLIIFKVTGKITTDILSMSPSRDSRTRGLP